VKLNKPPVVQTWIAFKFVPGPESPPWDLRTANKFFRIYKDQFRQYEAIVETTVEIQKFSADSRPPKFREEERLDKVRARNEDESHWLQVTADQMVCNRTRVDSYVGYGSLQDEALSKLVDYVDFFRPEALSRVELHYVDLIEIPLPSERKIDLGDYFRLKVDMPDEFGTTWHFSTRLFVQPMMGEVVLDDGVLEVKFQSVDTGEDPSTGKFRMDWNFTCLNLASWDRDIVRDRLDQAHKCLLHYFRASVTEKTWQLFQPTDEDGTCKSPSR
jgi:uncharacterized protein (TIGR04255 family)